MDVCSEAQSTNGHSPHFLLFGKEMRLPADIFYQLHIESAKPESDLVYKIEDNTTGLIKRLHFT